jgi:ribosome maturation factor RimP
VKADESAGKKNITKKIEELALMVTDKIGIELVGVDYKSSGKRPHLVVYIDKPGGVFLEDCEEVNKSLGEILDREDPIPSSYILEVSSPGIERPLKKPDDFRMFQGNYVKIKTSHKIKERKTFAGILKEFQEDLLIIETDEGEQFNIPLEEITKANLWYKQK